MKVLFYDDTQAYLTPGGKAVHANKLHKELSKLGVDVEFARWWDESQNDYDIIHFFSPFNSPVISYAVNNGKKNLLTHILDFETNKTTPQKKRKKLLIWLLQMLPVSIQSKFDWYNIPLFDHIVYMHKYDKETLIQFFPDIDQSKISVIPHAFDPQDIGIGRDLIIDNNFPKKYLVSCGTICERKQSVLLAKLAREVKVPIVFIGSNVQSDPYYQSFTNLIDNKYVFYSGYVTKEVKDNIESNASGFVLLSKGESGCIAVFEAAAYHLPILLSNLPWAWGYEDSTDIHYCNWDKWDKAASELKLFYDNSAKLNYTPFKIHSWAEIAMQYKKCYESVLSKP